MVLKAKLTPLAERGRARSRDVRNSEVHATFSLDAGQHLCFFGSMVSTFAMLCAQSRRNSQMHRRNGRERVALDDYKDPSEK